MSTRRGSRLRAFAAQLQGLLLGHQDDGLDAEMRDHLRLLAERFEAQGLSERDAMSAARQQFGSINGLREDRHALQTLPTIEALWHDLRHALRTLARSPGFTVVAIVTLGLGIGAATAIYSTLYNVLMQPFPERGADRMVFVRVHDTQQGPDQGRQGYIAAEILEITESTGVFDGFTAALGERVLYRHQTGTESFGAAHVTPGTFEFFGMPALHGRVLQPRDYQPDAAPVFVMRHKTWMERFGGDLSVLNTTVVLNGTPRTLVGIMPPRFAWYAADIYIPRTLTRDTTASPDVLPRWFLLGRLEPGVSIQQAEAELTVIAQRLATIYPQLYPARFTVQVGRRVDAVVGRFGATLYTVLAAVGFLLLIACSNVANLMLSRATTRGKEFALRAALGARRGRLVRLLMVESLVLAIAGAVLGVAIAWGALKLLVAIMPQNLIPAQAVIELNAPVLAFTLGIAMLTPLLFGLVPALRSSRPDLNDALRDSGKGTNGGFEGKRLRDAVVVLEIALSLTLLTGAGLLMRSFVALREVHLGLQPDHVFQVALQLPEQRYRTAEQMTTFLLPLLARVKALPGVEHAAVTTGTPLYSGGDSPVEIAGKVQDQEWRTSLQRVSAEYFDVLRVALRQGRPLSATDVDAARHVAVVNETFVRTYLTNADPLGQRIRLASLEADAKPAQAAWFEIVGVVGDMTNRGNLQAPSAPEVWVPSTIAGSTGHNLILRTAHEPRMLMNAVQREVWAADSDVALVGPGTLEDWVNERLYASPRFAVLSMATLGGVGLMLVTVGVYSVLAYSAMRKTHEIGIRMALGASHTDVLGIVVRSGLRPVVVGIAIGLVMSALLGRTLGAQLVGVIAHDPQTLAAAAAVLALTAAIACWIPARRAARLDPLVALRHD